jgi:hypothetical protein
MKRTREYLLREYIRGIMLQEFDGGGGMVSDLGAYSAGGIGSGVGAYGGDMGGPMGMFGAGWGSSSSDLKRAFFDPFADVFKTVFGKTKEVVRSAKTLFRVIFETLATTFIPFVTDSYEEIFEKEKQDLEKIRSEYSDVYERTNQAFSSGDAGVLGMVFAPGAAFGAALASKGPGVVKGLLDVVTGGSFSDDGPRLGAKRSGGGRGGKGGGPSAFFRDNYTRTGNRLYEADDQDQKAQVEKMIQDPKVLNAIKQKLKPLAAQIIKVKQEKLNDSVKMARSVVTAKSAKDLEKVISSKGTDALKKEILKTKGMEKATPEQIDSFISELPKKSGQMLQNVFVLPIKSEYEALKKQKAPAELLSMYEKAIAEMNSLLPG